LINQGFTTPLVIIGNSAVHSGGGAALIGTTSIMEKCTIEDNQASMGGGKKD
jgi:hypothetical protein